MLLGVHTVLPAGSHVLLQGATESPPPSTQADFPSIAGPLGQLRLLLKKLRLFLKRTIPKVLFVTYTVIRAQHVVKCIPGHSKQLCIQREEINGKKRRYKQYKETNRRYKQGKELQTI